ncbi:MFS general substrate transporter [Xylariaceae sp. FL1272]|nr:MFS general substrate transporter [Xylariaceae sp. FL1272]
MAADPARVSKEKTSDSQIEHSSTSEQDQSAKVNKNVDSGNSVNNNPDWLPQSDEDYNVTFKTWIVVAILSWGYGVSFWIVPALNPAGAYIATSLGDPSAASFYTAVYLLSITIAFMICGANSDLFGRRWFLIFGNVLLFIGFIVGGSAKNNTALLAAMGLIGFGAGNAQLAAFALPELLPNKWRAIGVVLADGLLLPILVVAPVAGRFAIEHGDAWRWLFYSPAIAAALSFVGLYLYYYPPAHPRGLPYREALKELDYVGAFLFIVSTVLILVGIVYTTVIPATNTRVIATLVVGFVVLIAFALWETFAPLKQPLTPPRVFKRGKGRELTAPFIAAFVVTEFYYAINIIYPTMINVFFTGPTTTFQDQIVLGLPSNLGLVTGALLLLTVGNRIGHWRWTLTASVTIMVVFGGLLALGTPERKGLMIAFVFLGQLGFGWAQYLSITFVQFGTEQVELGIAGGLAGVARFAGGAVAISIYTAILTNVQQMSVNNLVPAAATGAGLPESSVQALLSALALGDLSPVPGITDEIAQAASAAFVQSYVVGLRTTALSSLSFGIVGIIACLFCLDIGHKMNNKIEVYLENDVNAEKNRFH